MISFMLALWPGALGFTINQYYCDSHSHLWVKKSTGENAPER